MLRWIPACDAIEKNVFFPVGLSPRARQQARVKARWRGSHLAGRPHDQRGAISAAPADWTATCPHASQSVSQAVWGRPGVCAEGRLSQQRATKLRCPYHKVYHRYTGGSSYYPLPSTCSYNEIPTLIVYHQRFSQRACGMTGGRGLPHQQTANGAVSTLPRPTRRRHCLRSPALGSNQRWV